MLYCKFAFRYCMAWHRHGDTHIGISKPQLLTPSPLQAPHSPSMRAVVSHSRPGKHEQHSTWIEFQLETCLSESLSYYWIVLHGKEILERKHEVLRSLALSLG